MKKNFKILNILLIIVLISIIITIIINYYIINTSKKRILKEEDYSKLNNIDCILILGAGIWGDKPSPMLQDRLDEGIKLYKKGLSSKIIMSGDHGKEEYDEVNVMKSYAIEKGVPSKDIFMDHAGFSTYESVYRSKEVFLSLIHI